eukprot:scaffold73112_cov78-Phaeocystis_antarctica.AAC.1
MGWGLRCGARCGPEGGRAWGTRASKAGHTGRKAGGRGVCDVVMSACAAVDDDRADADAVVVPLQLKGLGL